MPYSYRLPAFVVLLLIITLVFGLSAMPRPGSSNRVLVIGDYSGEDGFGRAVYLGMCKARNLLPGEHGLVVVPVKVPESDLSEPDDLSRRIRTELGNALLAGKPRAVVAATRTSGTRSVIAMCESFEIPVIITVATNDSIMPPTSYPNGLPVLRLIASDKKQGWAIANAINEDTMAQQALIAQKGAPNVLPAPPLVIYEGDAYAYRLYEILTSALAEAHVAWEAMQVKDASEDFSIRLRSLGLQGRRTIVCLGYFKTFKPLLDELKALRWNGRVVMSDGCISPGVLDYSSASMSIYLSVPVTARAYARDTSDAVQGFEQYGMYAYIGLMHWPSESDKHFATPSSLNESIAAFAASWGDFNVRFTQSGENSLAGFRVIKLEQVLNEVFRFQES